MIVESAACVMADVVGVVDVVGAVGEWRPWSAFTSSLVIEVSRLTDAGVL